MARRPLFGNGFPQQVDPDNDLVVFDSAQFGDNDETFFVTAYYWFSPETTGVGVNAQVLWDSGPGTEEILLEDINNDFAQGLFLIDKGAILAIDRIPLSQGGRLIVRSESSSDQAFWVLGYFERGSADTEQIVGQRPLQPSKSQINTAPIRLTTGAPVASPVVKSTVLHELTTEYVDEITVYAGVTKDTTAETEDPILIII